MSVWGDDRGLYESYGGRVKPADVARHFSGGLGPGCACACVHTGPAVWDSTGCEGGKMEAQKTRLKLFYVSFLILFF